MAITCEGELAASGAPRALGAAESPPMGGAAGLDSFHCFRSSASFCCCAFFRSRRSASSTCNPSQVTIKNESGGLIGAHSSWGSINVVCQGHGWHGWGRVSTRLLDGLVKGAPEGFKAFEEGVRGEVGILAEVPEHSLVFGL